MYIISKFKDYYDSAVGLGIDRSIVYNREFGESITWEASPFNSKSLLGDDDKWFNSDNNFIYTTQWVVIGFCGRTYMVLRQEFPKQYDNSIYYEKPKIISPEDVYYYGQDGIDFILEKSKTEKTGNWRGFNRMEVLTEMFNKWHDKEHHDLFFELKAPIFTTVFFDYEGINKYDFGKYKRGEVRLVNLNPILKDLKFFKIFDSFKAFQEIQMFISGVLGVGDKQPEPQSDIEKVVAHGFDKKFSFRKDKQINKQNG